MEEVKRTGTGFNGGQQNSRRQQNFQSFKMYTSPPPVTPSESQDCWHLHPEKQIAFHRNAIERVAARSQPRASLTRSNLFSFDILHLVFRFWRRWWCHQDPRLWTGYLANCTWASSSYPGLLCAGHLKLPGFPNPLSSTWLFRGSNRRWGSI
ncbi:hypothetical protein VP01_792g1 [Puccinia sorghi]|uniref:Uncharacterized protein n=1 Tax=Puccinia sorghi TaxID=27349 RepID=A0A0L6UBM7_9BASI|nr:hypothetical protein VP01_792g1 [Puccinia sorghi]